MRAKAINLFNMCREPEKNLVNREVVTYTTTEIYQTKKPNWVRNSFFKILCGYIINSTRAAKEKALRKQHPNSNKRK